jgi:hypothetical protein
MVEEFRKFRQEALRRGEFITLANGERLVALPLVVPGGRGNRVYLGEYGRLYYRRGKLFYWLGDLGDIGRLSPAQSPLRPKKDKKLPRGVENVFKFFRVASRDLNPSLWQEASGYLEELRAAMGVGGGPERIYRVLNEGGWKDSYPLPSSLWDGARLKEPWTSLRSLTGTVWDVEGALRRLAEEALEKGVAWDTPPSMRYNVSISLRFLPDLSGFHAAISAEYQGLAHGHYGFIINWRGTVFLAETD